MGRVVKGNLAVFHIFLCFCEVIKRPDLFLLGDLIRGTGKAGAGGAPAFPVIDGFRPFLVDCFDIEVRA